MSNRPLGLVTTIYKTDNTTFVHNPFTGVNDFVVTRANIKPPYDSTGGRFEVSLVGKDGTNAEIQNILSNIAPGFEILFSVGKTSSTTDIFRGVVEKITIKEDSNVRTEVTLTGYDWGTDVLHGRIVNLYAEQKRLVDGVSYDTTDKTTNIYMLVKKLLGAVLGSDGTIDYSAYPGDKDNVSNRFSVRDQGLIVSTIAYNATTLGDSNMIDTGNSIPVININLTRLTDALAQLMAINQTTYFVKPDKTFVMRAPFDSATGALPSGILITDDYNDPLIIDSVSPWDSTKYGYIIIAPSNPSTYSLDVENQRLRLFAADETKGTPDQKDDPTTSITATTETKLDSKYLAVKFTPTRRRCSSIGVKISRTSAAPVSAIHFELREDFNNAPFGSAVAQGDKSANAIDTTPTFHYFGVNVDLNTAKSYWIVLYPSNDQSKYYIWDRDSTTSFTHATSTTDASSAAWTITGSSYGYCFRHNVTDAVFDVYPFGITAANHHIWEEVVRKQILTNNDSIVKFLTAQYSTSWRVKEQIECTVWSPDTPIQPGMQIKLKKQQSGYLVNDYYVVTECSYVFASTTDMQPGTYFISIMAGKWSDYNY